MRGRPALVHLAPSRSMHAVCRSVFGRCFRRGLCGIGYERRVLAVCLKLWCRSVMVLVAFAVPAFLRLRPAAVHGGKLRPCLHSVRITCVLRWRGVRSPPLLRGVLYLRAGAVWHVGRVVPAPHAVAPPVSDI